MIGNPYSRFKARSILWWQIIGLFAFELVLALVKNFIQLDEETESNILSVFIYICLCGWIYYIANQAGIDVRGLISNGEGVKPYILFGLVLLLVILSVGSGLLFGYLLSYLSPALLTSEWFQGKSYPSPSSFPLLNRLLDALTLVLCAPIVEEIIFRGIFLNRWTTKWNIRRAILLSSFFFAILHTGFVSSFLFGLCMCLLYLKSHTLFIPIIAHFLNNVIALGFGMFTTDSDSATENVVEAYRSALWLGIVCLAISLPPILLFIYRNYPPKGTATPHLVAEEDELSEPVESVTTMNTPYE
jgi:membrane protease YdiL (CAAX protease family)